MEEPHPSTSKEDAKANSKDSSHTNLSWSNSSQTKSNIDVTDAGLKMPNLELKVREKRGTKGNERNKRQKHRAGVTKRKNSKPKRNTLGKGAPKKPQNRRKKRERNLSISTIFTRLSSGSMSHICQYCGHKCCGRRSEYSSDRRNHQRYKRHDKRKIYKKGLKTKRNNKNHAGTLRNTRVAAIQAGSRANMLSPLFVKTNATLEDSQQQNLTYSEVSPEMIYEALRNLSMWRAEVKTEAILEYIKITYPVNPNPEELLTDLLEKLRIATLVGIVIRLTKDSWRLPTALQKRSLTETHVTIFWRAYADTMTPITRNKSLAISEVENKENQTETLYI